MKKIIIIIASVLIIIGISIVVVLKLKKEEEVINESDNNLTVIDEIKIMVEDKDLIVKLENNVSANALVEKLYSGDITIELEEYGGFEKVGSLGFNLPKRDKYLNGEPCDVILYNGNELTILYEKNTWNYTKIGRITNVTQEELKEIFGEGNVTITITK